MPYHLHYVLRSPFCRSVMMLAQEIGVQFDLKLVDMKAGSHLTPEYLAMNPQHTVPTLVDGDFVLWESHAILRYLLAVHAPDNSLYPKDQKERATVDRWLDYSTGSLVPAALALMRPVLQEGAPLDPDKLLVVKQKLAILDAALSGKRYLVTDKPTIADLSLVAFVSSLYVFEMDLSEFANIAAWKSGLAAELSSYNEINQKGLDELVEFFNRPKQPVSG